MGPDARCASRDPLSGRGPVPGRIRACFEREEGWRALGPVGVAGNEGLAGRVISLAVDPRNPNHVFAGSASGGLWVSELSGAGAPRTPIPARPTGATTAGPTGAGAMSIPAFRFWASAPSRSIRGSRTSSTSAPARSTATARRRRGASTTRPRAATTASASCARTTAARPGRRASTGSRASRPASRACRSSPIPAIPSRFTVWAATSEGVYRLDTTKSGGAPGTAEDWKLSLNVVAATSLSVNPRNPARDRGRVRKFRQSRPWPLQDEATAAPPGPTSSAACP